MNDNSLVTPLISVVVPLYNKGSQVMALLSDLKEASEQIACRFEIILVGDGSSDDTWERSAIPSPSAGCAAEQKFWQRIGALRRPEARSAAATAAFDLAICNIKTSYSMLVCWKGTHQER